MKTIVIGIGNILFCDDGIGVFTANILKKSFKFSPEIEVIDGGTLGIGLINYFVEYDNVIILDTISVDDEVGSIYSLPSNELLNIDGYKNTAHEVEVVDMIRTASLIENPANVIICGIVPKDIESVKIALTKELEQNFENYLNVVLNEIKKLNIKTEKIKEYSLDEEIKGVFNVPRLRM